MKLHSNILHEPGAPGLPGTGTPAAPPADWRVGLPDDLKANPIFTNIADVQTLAKGYANAQAMIGAKRIALPGPNATESERNEFYKAIGRPDAPDKYSEFTAKPLEGLNMDKASIQKARETFHKLGLNDDQQKGLMDFYVGGLNETHTGLMRSMDAGKATAEQGLKSEWGQGYEANVAIANAVVKKFASADAVAELETGLGNNPALIKMFYGLGKAMLEEKTPGNQLSIQVGGVAAAQTRIAELKGDKVFMASLDDPRATGHKDAVALWHEVHRQATHDNRVISAH